MEVHLIEPGGTAESHSPVDNIEVLRVLGYLQEDEAAIRASKINPVWADTMARATDLIRKLAYATGA